jgi:hypothetical protein
VADQASANHSKDAKDFENGGQLEIWVAWGFTGGVTESFVDNILTYSMDYIKLKH